MTNQRLPFIPEFITVHLGSPDSNAANVTVPFADYIKNVASSEIYPTWPEAALRANILAQITFALNRVYTEYYRSRGYPFDITSSTAIDQAYVNGRDIFENINQIVDEIFDNYITRGEGVEPIFALYCNGTTVSCEGLSQWGSVELAENGLGAFDILQNYYGNNISLVTDAPVQGITDSYPGAPLSFGSSGEPVRQIQVKLNRISKNYPAIPKIPFPDGSFQTETQRAVTAFQEIFSLAPDGIVGRSTWNAINRIYAGVKNLSDINSEGIPPEDITSFFGESLAEGESGVAVRELQYLLLFISAFNNQIPPLTIDGIFGPDTREAVISFQRFYGIPQTGEVDFNTWRLIYDAYVGILNTLPEGYFSPTTEPYGGTPLRLGSEGEDVSRIQDYLNFISNTYTEIPKVTVDGIFGPATQAAVLTYQNLFGLEPTSIVSATTYNSIADTYRVLREGAQASGTQYGGDIPNNENQ
ncbi:MAG: peptidoglycan-binding protein [Clostridia bacterium]|nr:peptidoglycan-binding protein [Clostridia bacterium]